MYIYGGQLPQAALVQNGASRGWKVKEMIEQVHSAMDIGPAAFFLAVAVLTVLGASELPDGR
jgi:hypothetical protein